MRNPNPRNLVLAGLMAAMICVAAQLSFKIPVSPVPITLQVLIVALAGGLLGPFWGAMSMLVYILLGVVGLPVFSNAGHGPAVLFGPTGGYLMSYPVAAAVIGLLAPAQAAPKLLRTGAAMLAGLAVIYLGGGGWAVLWGGKALAVVVNGWVLPFVPLDLIKVAVAAALSVAVNRALVAQGFWRSQRA